MKHLNLVFPQWQGGGKDLSTYLGAEELEHMYMKKLNYTKIPVDTSTDLKKKNKILGYDQILTQLEACHVKILEKEPETIFTIGGGCDADIPPISYLAGKYGDDFTLLWIDAHGDLNTPAESNSSLFYGMPLRTLMGDGDARVTERFFSFLKPEQVIHIGGRDFDPSEENFISSSQLKTLPPNSLNNYCGSVWKILDDKPNAKLYIHLDLDVLDPREFTNTPMPSPNGLSTIGCLEYIPNFFHSYDVVGLGVFEYRASRKRTKFLEYLFRNILSYYQYN